MSWYYVSIDSSITTFNITWSSIESMKNIRATKEQAEACLAMSQLSQLMKNANWDWKPDYGDYNSQKFSLYYCNNSIQKDYWYGVHRFLTFQTREIRDQFLENHKELIEKAKPLL